MEKYILSKNITISNIDPDNEPTTLYYRQGYHIIYDAKYRKSFLINETISYFINKFQGPKTLPETIQEVQSEIGNSDNKIEESCSSFFQFLCERKILVPSDKDEVKVDSGTLYKAGDNINQWQIVEVLSNKRYVDIYTALDKAANVTCVIKLLNRNKIPDAHKYQKKAVRMQREYTLLQKAKNIATVSQAYAFEKDKNENVYIVLEFIKGKGLSYFLRGLQAFSQKEYLQVIEKILEGFASLHQHNLIHGDIHPSNVMVNEDKTVRIIDLGFSKDANTEKNEVIKFGGVNYYMPPERINITTIKKYHKEPDLYSDVYQIGLLLYLILYNNVPFKGFIWEELAQNIKQENINFSKLSFWGEDVPLYIIEIIKKCANKEATERYADATIILNDFKKHISKAAFN